MYWGWVCVCVCGSYKYIRVKLYRRKGVVKWKYFCEKVAKWELL